MHLEVAPLLVWGGHSCPPPLMLIAARTRIAETVTIVGASSFAAKGGNHDCERRVAHLYVLCKGGAQPHL
jgi:hypothetical protein